MPVAWQPLYFCIMPEKTILQVKGMTCSSCAEGIARHLHKKGLPAVHVSYDTGTVEIGDRGNWSDDRLIHEINSLGYKASAQDEHDHSVKTATSYSRTEILFVVSAILTLPLLLHMTLENPLLHQPFFQFILATPVMLIGLYYFGKSAVGSIMSGSPNMDVLITTGSLSAYLYSITSWLLSDVTHVPLYFETGATIITLVLLGNIIEQRSLKRTRSSIDALTKLQPHTALLIENALTDQEQNREIPVKSLKENDLVFIPEGARVPADG